MRALGLYLCALLASVHGASCGNECTRSSSISCTSGQVQEKQDSSCSTFGTGCGVTFRSDCFECCDPGECTCSNLKAFVDTLPNCTSTTELLSQVGMWRANNNCTALTPLFDGDEVFDNVTERPRILTSATPAYTRQAVSFHGRQLALMQSAIRHHHLHLHPHFHPHRHRLLVHPHLHRILKRHRTQARPAQLLLASFSEAWPWSLRSPQPCTFGRTSRTSLSRTSLASRLNPSPSPARPMCR